MKDLFLTVLFGWTGYWQFAHKKSLMGIVYFFTFGLFGFGWLIDIFRAIKALKPRKKISPKISSTVSPTVSSDSGFQYNAPFPRIALIMANTDYFPDNYVVLDFETTGLEFYNGRIIDINCDKYISGELADNFSTLVNPEMTIGTFTENLTGIKNDMLLGAPKIYEVIDDLYNFIGKSDIVGHNVTFDMNFYLSAVFGKHKDASIPKHVLIDTVKYAKTYFPTEKSYKLENLKTKFNIETTSHRSKEDCYVTNYVLGQCKIKFTEDKRLSDLLQENIINSFNNNEKIFHKTLSERLLGVSDGRLELSRNSDKTLVYSLGDVCIGRVKLTGKIYKMQLQSSTKSIFLDNITLETALSHIDQWVSYAESL